MGLAPCQTQNLEIREDFLFWSPHISILSFFFLTASLGSRGHKIHINHYIQTEASRSAFKVTHTVSMSILEMVWYISSFPAHLFTSKHHSPEALSMPGEGHALPLGVHLGFPHLIFFLCMATTILWTPWRQGFILFPFTSHGPALCLAQNIPGQMIVDWMNEGKNPWWRSFVI